MLLLVASGALVDVERELLPGYSTALSPGALAARERVGVVEDSLVNDGRRPRYHLQVFAVDQALVFDRRIALRAAFFNGELMSLTLYPPSDEDSHRLRSKLANMHHVTVEQIRASVHTRGLDLDERVDANSRRYIDITRTSVRRKLDAWLFHHS